MADVQRHLNRIGYRVKVDNVFGPQTAKAWGDHEKQLTQLEGRAKQAWDNYQAQERKANERAQAGAHAQLERDREAQRLAKIRGLPAPPPSAPPGAARARAINAALNAEAEAKRYPAKPAHRSGFVNFLAAAYHKATPNVLERVDRATLKGAKHFSKRGVVGELHAAGVPGVPESPRLAQRFVSELGQAGVYTPAGAVLGVRAAQKDVEETTGVHGFSPIDAAIAVAYGKRPSVRLERPHLTLKRTAELGKEMAVSTAESFRHPGRHPGYFALNALAAAGLAIGTASRIGAASSAARESWAAEALRSRKATPESFASELEAKAAKYREEHTGKPGRHARALLNDAAEMEALAKQVRQHPDRLQTALSSFHGQGLGYRGVPDRAVTAARAAVARPSHEGGGILHRPAPGTTTLETVASKGRAGVHALRLHAKEAVGPFRSLVDDLAKQTGAEAQHSPTRLKLRARMSEKAADYGGDVTRIKDVVRGRLVVDTPEQMRAIVDGIRERGMLAGSKDTLSRPDPVSGYGDLKLYVRLENGHVAELQVVPRPLERVYEQVRPHYDEERTLKGIRGRKRREELNGAMRAGYGQALQEWDRQVAASQGKIPPMAAGAAPRTAGLPILRPVKPRHLPRIPRRRSRGPVAISGPPRPRGPLAVNPPRAQAGGLEHLLEKPSRAPASTPAPGARGASLDIRSLPDKWLLENGYATMEPTYKFGQYGGKTKAGERLVIKPGLNPDEVFYHYETGRRGYTSTLGREGMTAEQSALADAQFAYKGRGTAAKKREELGKLLGLGEPKAPTRPIVGAGAYPARRLEGALRGYEVKIEKVGPEGLPHTTLITVSDDAGPFGELEYDVRRGVAPVENIRVNDDARGTGIAAGMLARAHRETGLPIEHGGFGSPDGVGFGVYMAARFPSWNKLRIGVDEQGRPKWWNPREPLTVQELRPQIGPLTVPRLHGEPSARAERMLAPEMEHYQGVIDKAIAAAKSSAAPAPRIATPRFPPKPLYHGTAATWTKLDVGKLDEGALYGPGLYLTDNPEVASGYAENAGFTHRAVKDTREEAEQMSAWLDRRGIKNTVYPDRHLRENPDDPGGPLITETKWVVAHARGQQAHVRIFRNVRPKRPFRIDSGPSTDRFGLPHATIPQAEAARLFRLAHLDEYNRGTGTEVVRELLRNADRGATNANGEPLRYSGDFIYQTLADHIGKTETNRVLRRAGYDAIVHTGGKITGGVEHTVTIIIDKRSVLEPKPQPRVVGAGAVPRSSSNRARSTGTPSERSVASENGRGEPLSQARGVSSRAGSYETGIPSTSYKATAGGESTRALLSSLQLPPNNIRQTLPGIRVERLEPDAAYARPFHRYRTRSLNRQLQAGTVPSEFRFVRFLQRHFGAENTLRRELAERHRVEFTFRQAPAEVAKAIGRKLSAAENAAVRVIAIEGSHAFRHPEEAIGRHIDFHVRAAQEGIDAPLNIEISKDLQAALPVLRNPSRDFLRAVAIARKVSRQAERDLLRLGLGNEAIFAERRAGIAAEYGRTGQRYRLRSRDRAVLENRLAFLDRKYEKLVQAALDQGYGDSFLSQRAKRIETLDRNRRRSRRVRGRPANTELKTVNEEIRAAVEDQIQSIVEKHPELPESQLLREREDLRARLNQDAEQSMGIEEPGTRVEYPLGVEHGFDRYGAPKGSFYFPTGSRFKERRRGLVTTATPSRRPGAQGLGPPQASRFLAGTMHKATFKGLKRGVVEHPLEAIAERATGVNRLVQADRMHTELEQAAHTGRRSEWDVPIRAAKDLPIHTRRQLAVEVEKLSGGDESALSRALELLKPEEGDTQLWVDSRMMPEFVAGSPSKILKGAAAFNKPFRVTGVFARPAYVVTNRPQNFIMRKLAQGLRTRKQIPGRVAEIRRQLGDDLSAQVDALAGEARTESYEPHLTRVGRGERALVRKITELTDRNERFLAVLSRAWEQGFQTETQLRQLLTSRDPAIVAKRLAIARRADKDMVQFSSLSPLEAEVAQFIYFYPWLSRGSMWAGRFVIQHPIKAALLAALAQQGQKNTPEWLKQAPSWTAGYLSSRFGLSNPAPVNTFATPVELAQTIAHPRRESSFGQELGTPALEALSAPAGDVPGLLLGGGTAPGRIARGLGLEKIELGGGVSLPLGKPSKSFPPRGPVQAVAPFLVGGPFPRKPDKAALLEAGKKEHAGQLDPIARVAANHKEWASKVFELAKKAGLEDGYTQLSPATRAAIATRVARFQNRERFYKEHGISKPEPRDRYEADIGFLLRRGKIDRATYNAGIRWADSSNRTNYGINKEIRGLSDRYFDAMYGDQLGEAVDAIRRRGYDVPGLPR